MDNEDIDINRDGKVSKEEVKMFNLKATTRRKMAWVALLSMLFVMLSLIFFVPEAKLDKLGNLIDLFWLGMASIVGAYVGIETWMNKK